jgi:hypothetical protein
VNKLYIALAAYAALAALAWQTLTDETIRLVTLVILALFAMKTLTHSRRVAQERHENFGSRAEGDEKSFGPM